MHGRPPCSRVAAGLERRGAASCAVPGTSGGSGPAGRPRLVRVAVRGGSMRPLLCDGDRVRVLVGAPPRTGDVVVALTGGRLLVHRVTRRRPSGCELRGDDAPLCDPPIEAGRVLGRVVAVEGDRHRRLDGPGLRLVGLAAAAMARRRGRAGGRPSVPRPAAVARLGLQLADAWPPPPPTEDRLAVLLAGPARGEPARSRARDWVEVGIDWRLLGRRALLGQIGPCALVGAQELLGDRIPPVGALDDLKAQLAANVARSRRIDLVLGACLDRLASAGIPVMAHKGVALAATVYRGPALRVMGDLDLCVDDADLPRALAVTRDVREALARDDPDRRGAGGLHVEIDCPAHHDLDPARYGGGRWLARSLDWAGMWRRARTVGVAGRQVLVPAPDDLIATLVANAVRRGFSPVRTTVDLAHTVQCNAGALDWGRFEAELGRTGLDRRAWVAFGLAAEWCLVEVPAPLLEPPAGLCPAVYERMLLGWKRRRPYSRMPSRVLWAGSRRAAVVEACRLGAGVARTAARRSRRYAIGCVP